jgi:hypothetical protein
MAIAVQVRNGYRIGLLSSRVSDNGQEQERTGAAGVSRSLAAIRPIGLRHCGHDRGNDE